MTKIDCRSRVRRFDAPLKETQKPNKLYLSQTSERAFTLAEVLITLVVIGIIAAITVPMIHANYKKQETVSKLKKTYSSLRQAIRLAELDYGPINEWYKESEKTNEATYNTFFKPYLRNTKLVEPNKVYGKGVPFKYTNGEEFQLNIHPNYNPTAFMLDDGVFVYIYGESKSTGELRVLIDLDAGKGQNRAGRDVFLMMISRTKGLIPLCTFDSASTCTDSYLIKTCNKNYKSSGGACLEKIMRDGWQINDDYFAW